MDILLDNFKQLTTTSKNVEQLKKLVLQLAVQGKLTEEWRRQNPDVEPASALLERIRAEKERLIKEGKIKRQKLLPEITEEEKVFDLPEGWEWCRLGEIGELKSGNSYKLKQGISKDIPYVKVGDMNLEENLKEILTSSIHYVFDESVAKQLIPKRSIIFPKRGGAIATNKRKKVLLKEILVDSNTMAVVVPNSISFNYFFLWFNTIDLSQLGNDSVIPQVNNKDILPLIYALPPHKEQKAIVEKVESLFAKIDRLHELAQKKAETRQKAARAMFGGINNAANEEDLQATWQLLKKNFAQVSQSKGGVKQLRQSILQLAVQGRLSAEWRRQNPDVEPASKLLERIRAEKERLIKEGKIKRQKPLPEIAEEEKVFDLPEGWEWCRIGKLCDMIYGSSLTKSECIPNGKYPVYGSNGVVGFYNEYLTEKKAIIVGRKGSSGALNISEYPSWTTDVSYYIEKSDNLEFLFFYHLLKSLNLEKMGKGIKPGLNRNEFYELVTALPPLSEQKTIVEKVNRLMSWCDELEKKTEERETLHEKIMQAVVKQAI